MRRMRIRVSTELSKELWTVLTQARRAGDLRLFRRVSALRALGQGEAVESVAASLGVSSASVYTWLKMLLVEGVAGLRVRWHGGRPSKLTKTQKRRLVELVKAGPEAAGFPTGCWTACLIQHLIPREFGVDYNVQYVADLLMRLGFWFEKASFVSDHLDEALRLEWLTNTWQDWLRRE